MPRTPGSHLGQYELIRMLGVGGMGEVWLAIDSRLGRKVAIKLLPTAVTGDDSRVRRFEQEARAASTLSHPNVCTIHALEQTDDGQHFIVMEYIEGQTLRARLESGRMPLRDVLDVGIQVASALTTAHAAGVVHRDVKPENVMLRSDSLVKVLDFGLAKLVEHDSNRSPVATQTATTPGIVLGTAHYMSPEQARGLTVDTRTDVWSLGVVLYEMAAARPPFAGPTTSDVIAAILEHNYEPLSRLAADLPSEFARIVGKTLRKDPEQRYQVMKDLLLDLEALRDEMLLDRSVPAQPALTDPRSPHRGAWVLASILLLGFLVALWGYRTELRLAFARRPEPPRPIDRPLRRLTFEPGLQTDAAFSPDGRSFAYTSDRAGNFDIWVQSLDGGPARQLTHSLAPDTQPAWSPDGTRIVFRSERDQGGLYRVSLDGGPETQLTSFGVRPVWSADGAEVLFRTEIFPGAQTAIHAVSPEGGEAPRDLAQDFARSGNWSWLEPHPDGRVSGIGLHLKSGVGFYTASRDGKNVVASRLGKDGEWKDLAAAAWRFSWNANGTLLYVEAVFNQVRNVWRVRVDPVTLDWITAERLTTGSGQDVAAALAPAGGRMVFTQQQESRRLWVIPIDADAARVSGSGTAITPEDGRAEGVSLSPDGRRVAYTLLRAGRVRGELLVTELESNNTELFSTDAIAGGWSPDSRTLAYSLKRPDVVLPQEWALAVRQVGGPERIIGRWSKTEAFLPTDWTRDGASLLGSYQSPPFTGPAALALWPLSSPAPKQRTLIEAPGFSLWQGKLSPNGRWLAFVAQPLDEPNRLGMYVARERAPVSEWMQIASSHPWADKPRWAPNGRVLYFISKRGAPHFNLWGVRFDPDRGTPIGDSFALTRFDTPGLRISPDVGWTEIGISATRAVVTMETTRGNIWMMDNVDR